MTAFIQKGNIRTSSNKWTCLIYKLRKMIRTECNKTIVEMKKKTKKQYTVEWCLYTKYKLKLTYRMSADISLFKRKSNTVVFICRTALTTWITWPWKETQIHNNNRTDWNKLMLLRYYCRDRLLRKKITLWKSKVNKVTNLNIL